MRTKTTKGKRVKKMIWLVVKVIFGIMIGINLLAFLAHIILSRGELETIRPYGQMVEVNDGKMHVHSMGNGKETIVLLPGWGVALPSAEFGPLMRGLSEKYTVVSIDYFGVGFSDTTDTPRVNENYVDEIRTALAKAGFKPPYILMPHSASGIYSEYYASTFPEEVSAIIMLDTTSTAVIEKMPGYVRLVYSLAKFQQGMGATRANSYLLPDPRTVANGYTQQEIADYRKFSYYAVNDTMINQSLLFMDNIAELGNLPFPAGVPVLKIIASDSLKRMGMDYHQAHLDRLGSTALYKIVEATHFIYHTSTDEIVTITDQFLAGARD